MVVRRGRKAASRTVVVHLLDESPVENPAHPVPRVGLVVSKAVGSATDRNRVKRRLRHLMRDRLDTFSPGDRVVVRALPAASGQSAHALARDLDRVLAEVGAR